jgi:hypothetical protein
LPRCVACLQGFTWECENGGCTDNPDNNNQSEPNSSTSSNTNGQTDSQSDLPFSEEAGEFDGREVRQHNDSSLRDQQSTGRKRAAVMYPLDREADCEWKMQSSVGGGPKPIIGCLNGKQQARHHGPDKNTLNNDRGNVHRICHNCHNRWHTQNDEIYVWGIIQNPHSPVAASLSEIGQSEVYWAGRKLVKANDG